jgi:hypothetical protein
MVTVAPFYRIEPIHRSAREGDERFETITGRRAVLETAFAQVAQEVPRVTILRE